MNFTVKSAVAGVLLSGASLSAFATSVTPPASGPVPTPGTQDGGVIVEVYDLATGHSLTEWVGGDVGTFGGPAGVPAGATAGGTLDYGILGGSTTFSGLFSSTDISSGAVSFTVSAVNDVTTTAPIVDLTLSKIGTIRLPAVQGIAGAAISGASVMNGLTACNNANPCTAVSTTSPGYAVNYFGGSLGGLGSTSSAAGVVGGSAVNFYQIIGTGTSTTAQTPVIFGTAANPGAWTLSSSGDLTYSVPGTAAVPVPAAVWLLGSGLLGLAGIARRKVQAA